MLPLNNMNWGFKDVEKHWRKVKEAEARQAEARKAEARQEL